MEISSTDEQQLSDNKLQTTYNHKNLKPSPSPHFLKSKVIINNDKIRVIEKYFISGNGILTKTFIVNVKGKVSTKLGKVKHTEILSEKEFWKFMENYLVGLF